MPRSIVRFVTALICGNSLWLYWVSFDEVLPVHCICMTWRPLPGSPNPRRIIQVAGADQSQLNLEFDHSVTLRVMQTDCGFPKVTFFPPLHHQRRIWILDVLRRERLTEIVDIGCGEGALLATICQPAPWLRPGHSQDDDHELSSLLLNMNIGLNDQDTPDLHATRLAGLDISSSQLDIAAQYTSPASVNPLYTRWEPLDVELWKGSVDVINPAFVNVQCIVASELIEHLTDDVLAQVAPIVLGVYRPRMFLVTTPSYTFNQRWSPPGVGDPQGYPDPTGRSDRVFRHSDHKFEWTANEFGRWCESVAEQWGYVAKITTIGKPKEQDPWGRDDVLGGATQVASFRRRDDHFSKAAREHGVQNIRCANKEPHTLVASHRHEAHPRAGYPSSHKEIEDAMILNFQEWRERILGVQELWFTNNLPVLCGGSIDVMLDAAEQSTELELQRVAGQQRGNWKIQLLGRLTDHFPEQIAPMESECVICDDDEPDCDVGDNSFDSGVHMGMTYDGGPWRPEDIGWTQVSGDEATNWNESWAGTTSAEWEGEL